MEIFKRTLSLALALCMLLSALPMGVFATDTADREDESPLDGEQENTVNVLLVQSYSDFSGQTNYDVLHVMENKGYIDSYTCVSPENVAEQDLSQYTMVLFASWFDPDMYDIFEGELADQVSDYVAGGGILYFSAYMEVRVESRSGLPGGLSIQSGIEEYNYIVDGDHPIVTGEAGNGNALTDEMLCGYYCSYTRFDADTLPEGSNVILETDDGAPTLVEYSFGSGYIVASCLNWEYYYAYRMYNGIDPDNGMRGEFALHGYENVLTYTLTKGLEEAAPDVTEPPTEEPTEPPTEEPTEPPTEEPTEPETPTTVLLIEDKRPWSLSSNEDLLKDLQQRGYIDEYVVTTMSAASSQDLSQYALVMFGSCQSAAFYQTYVNQFAEIVTEYVANGGILYFSVCGQSGSSLAEGLPGGVEQIYSAFNYNYIVDSDHPIVTGELTGGTPLTDAMLYGTKCNHQVFVESTLPEGTNVILRGGSTTGAPTLVEYPYGSGYVVASGLTWEFYYAGSGGRFARNSYDDVIVYALSQNRYDTNTWPVGNLHTVRVGSKSVELAWNPARNGNVIGYRVYRDGELIADVAECAYTDSGLTANTAYEYQVIGYTAGGLETAPAKLTAVTRNLPHIHEVYTDFGDVVTPGSTTVYARVLGAAALDGAVVNFYYSQGVPSYSDYISGNIPKAGTATTYTMDGNDAVFQIEWDITDLAEGEYYFGVRMTDPDGQKGDWMGTLNVDKSAPSRIEGLTAQGDVDAVLLSWYTAAEYKVNAYRVYRRTAGETQWQLLGTVTGSDNTAYTDSTAEKGVTYEYTVTALSRYGLESEYCDAVTGALISDMEKPVIKNLFPARNTVLSKTVTVSAAATDNDAVSAISLYYRVAGGEAVLIGSAEAASVSASLDTTGLPDGAVEIFAIAVDAAGNESDGNPVYTCTVDNTAPACVTDLTFTSTATVITLSWDYVQDDDFSHFVVEEKAADGTFRTVATANKTLGVNLTGLRPETAHTYRVCVVDQVGNVSEYSSELTAMTAADETAPVVSAITPGAGYRNADFTVTFTMKDDDCVAGAQVQVSRDRLNWETVEEKTFATVSGTQTLRYTVTVSDYPADGSLYVRAIPVDAAGNSGDSSQSAPFVEYVLDRTPPAVPQKVLAQASGTSICITWVNDAAGETVSYRILRAASEDGPYEIIESGVKYISYYDRTAEADTTYWYRVEGRDSVGNYSQGSTPVSASWTNSTDTQAPEILSAAPANGSSLGGTANTISVLAQDDRLLSRIEVTCARIDLQGNTLASQVLTADGDGSYYLSASVKPDLSGCATGDRMQVTIVAYDGNDNPSAVKEYTYTIDRTAPAVTDLTAALDGAAVTITWNAGENSGDLNGYYIYRSAGSGWTRLGTRAAREDGKYSFTDTLTASGSYTYKVVAIDLIGNQAEFVSAAVSYTKPAAQLLIADFTTDRQQQQGVEYLFNASASYSSDSAIVAYHYDFGDGTTADKVRAIHAYQELGTYTVVLTVTNANGATHSASMTVEVKERASLGDLTVTVVDDTGAPVGGTPVYFDMETENQIVKYTDAKGTVTFTAEAGTYTIGAYKDGYLPVTKQAILTGSTTRAVELVMVEQPIVTGEFEVHRMTLEEIKAAGIDVTDSANQNCVSVTVQVSYGEQMVDFDFVRNDRGQVVFGENTTTIGDRQFTAIILPEAEAWGYTDDDASGDNSGEGGAETVPGISPSDIVVILETPVSASFLKEFFDVKLHIINQAAEEFSLVNNLVELNVPEGMTLMAESQSSAAETRAELKGQQDWTLSWILRGDTEGKYTLNADYSGVLSGFNVDVNARFESPEIQVYGSSAVHLVLNLNKSLRYQTCYFDLGIKNVTETDLNLPSVGVSNAVVNAFSGAAASGELTDAIVYDAAAIRTWVQNAYGYAEFLEEEPQLLTGGETLYHRYAVYGVTEDHTVQYLNNIILKELNNLGLDQIEVYVNNLDLYPDDTANAEQIMENGRTTAKDAMDYLTNPNNFLYYQVGYDDENSPLYHASDIGKAALDLFLSLDFDCFTHNKEEKFFRAIVAELMSDEVVADYVSARIDETYANIAQEILSTLATTMKTMDAEDDNDFVDSTFEKLARDKDLVTGLGVLVQKEGVGDNFKARVARLVSAELANFTYESIIEILDKPDYFQIVDTSLAKELGEAGDVFDFGSKLANGWADGVEAANVMLTLKYAEEETTYFLQTLVDVMTENGHGSHWMCKEAGKMLEELQEATEEERSTMIRVMGETMGQALAELGTEKISDLMKQKTREYMAMRYGFVHDTVIELSGVYKILKTVYALADYTLNLSDYYERHDQLIAMMTMNAMLMTEFQDAETAVDKVHALKYIIKTHLVGERVYADYINASDTRRENFEKGAGITVNVYLTNVTTAILKARDKLYNTVTTQSGVPEAPASLTFDYQAGQTVESFDAAYEYSLNGGESWTTCGINGEAAPIPVAGKTIAQHLYVRLKATEANRAGATAALTLNAAPRHPFATEAGAAGETCMVWGLMTDTAYQLLRVSSPDAENPDWSKAVIAAADENGTLKAAVPGDGGYLLYRLPATGSAFASVANSIALTRDLQVQITASAEGDGSVLCDGEAFTAVTVEHGAALTLTASYDTVTTEFLGWFVDGELYADKAVLELEATEDLVLTAKFAPLDQFTLTVIAGEGGRVTGSGTYYKGQKAVARAFAANGYTFGYWTDENDNPVSILSTRNLTMMENVTLKAVFEKLPGAQIFVALSVQEMEGVELPTAKVEVAGKTYTVTTAEPLAEVSGEILQGETITLTAYSTASATFDSWQTDKGAIVSQDPVFTTTAAEYTSYVAVYKVAGQTVTFTDMKGNVLSSRQYGASVDAGQILIPGAPAMDGYDFTGWKQGDNGELYPAADEAALREFIREEVAAGRDVTMNAQYSKQVVQYTVTVINGTGSGTYAASTALTVTANAAPEGQYFVGWYEGDTLLSPNERYGFFVTADRTIEARFAEKEVEAVGVTNIQSVACNTTTGKISFVSMSSVPTDCKILKAGVVATSDPSIGEDDQLTAANAAYVRYGTTSSKNYKYTWTKSKVTADQTWYVRAYLVYADANGNTYTVYSDTVKATLNNGVED